MNIAVGIIVFVAIAISNGVVWWLLMPTKKLDEIGYHRGEPVPKPPALCVFFREDGSIDRICRIKQPEHFVANERMTVYVLSQDHVK